MAEKTPLYMDINNVYSGDEMGLPNRDFISEGIVLATDLAVTAGAGNTVNIAAGACWVVGDTDIVNQPTYRIINDAVVNLGINPDPTNPRIVRVGMQINDATFTGVLRSGVLTAIHGTPAGAPVAPAEPASFLTLATVLVPAAAASSAAYTFTDLRARSRVGGGQSVGSGLTLLWDSVDAGVTLPTASITTPVLPGSYKHLVIEYVVENSVGSQTVAFRVNGDTGANYFYENLQAAGATASCVATSAATNSFLGLGGTAEPCAGTARIFDYARSGGFAKQFVGLSYCQNDGSGTMKTWQFGGMWNSSAAITTLTFFHGSGNIIAGSRISVYGEA